MEAAKKDRREYDRLYELTRPPRRGRARGKRVPDDPRKRQASRFGIPIDALLSIHNEHKGACAACKDVPSGGGKHGSLRLDHDHSTGRVRGLLCNACNVALGLLRDDPARIRALADYVCAVRYSVFVSKSRTA